MASQTIAGIDSIQLNHITVSGYFGNDGSAGNGEGKLVTMNYAPLREGNLRQGQGIDKEEIGRDGELFNCQAHCLASGFDDAIGINFLRGNHAHPYGYSPSLNLFKEGFPLFGG